MELSKRNMIFQGVIAVTDASRCAATSVTNREVAKVVGFPAANGCTVLHVQSLRDGAKN
jgi:hypothetical protein